MDEEKRAGPEQQPGAELPAFAGQETIEVRAFIGHLLMKLANRRIEEARALSAEAAKWFP